MQAVPTTVTAYIGLGANLGAPRDAVLAAMDAIAATPGIEVTKRSALYGSTPVDAGGDDYINAVLEIATAHPPHQLLAALQAVEQAAGRLRPYRNAPRTLDLDVLLYGQLSVNAPALVIPHPRMWERAFVLLPLSEIAPHLVDAARLQAVLHQGVWRIA